MKQTNDQICNRQKHLHSYMSKAAQIRIIQTPTKLPNSPPFKTALVKIWGFEAAEGQQQKTSQDRLLLWAWQTSGQSILSTVPEAEGKLIGLANNPGLLLAQMRTLQLNGTSLQSGCSQVTAREDGMLLDANVWVTLCYMFETQHNFN